MDISSIVFNLPYDNWKRRKKIELKKAYWKDTLAGISLKKHKSKSNSRETI